LPWSSYAVQAFSRCLHTLLLCRADRFWHLSRNRCRFLAESSTGRMPIGSVLRGPRRGTRCLRQQPSQPATDRSAREAAEAIATNPPVHAGGFFCSSRGMSERVDDELKLLLARAFDRAWKRYYRPGRIGAISAGVARPSLAIHLIALAKEGVVSFDALAEGGLLHLLSLTPEAQHWGHLRIERAGARFQPIWRVSVKC
jgi:hypothetical protein